MPLRQAQAARCSRSRSRLVAREYFEWTCRSAWKRIWCPDFEIRKLLRHPLMRTSESKGHQQIYDSSVVLDLKFLTASLLSAAAQDSTMGASPDLREVERFGAQRIDRA